MPSTDPSILARLERLRQGGRPRVLDLFSGCGGLSLGFHACGFEIAAAVELDRDAAASHCANFHPDHPRHGRPRDIMNLTPQALATELGLGPINEAVDVLVGGPPCQAFARVGRSKLREVAEHPEAFRLDPRARLYLEYLRYVQAFRPLVLMMENVPDVLNHGGQNVAEETREFLEEIGYDVKYTLLNAAFYGVPQMRERMVLIAVRRELNAKISFPEPTHHIELPPGYAGSRQVALKLLRGAPIDGALGYVPAKPPHRELTPAVTAAQALSDLPLITGHLRGEIGRSVRRFDRLEPYPGKPHTGYAKLMRTWPGFENDEGICDHVIRYLPRDWKLFGRLNPGDQYPEAHAAAVRMFDEALVQERARTGAAPKTGSKAWHELRASIVPPYDTGKFPNKWRKMEPDLPARTLMAHLGKDSYSHIHYDSAQSRTISVREAARLQSFPDGFIFRGAMNAAFRQIGNAVPPLLSRALAEEIGKIFASALRRDRPSPNRRAA
ncbi:DNA cytosine methyltransferase [Mesorhizobium sp. NZP2298]|uniref:DNA cytosine methyltransferase n=1 Tax=Mesorhizobium sp. NZP2298 TaxID=2483403 RepID=UPI0015565824|nr:DNA cytosine methyltransferase [Mesorhizobium sp. NZP2298]QKC97161.1 DNA cytosine methyltransferase [Mesorhizobium sp. NZP2298]